MPLLARLRDVADRHAGALDIALGTAIAALGVLSLWTPPQIVAYDFRDPDVLGVALAVLAGVGVALRSRTPVPALVLTSAASLTALAAGYSNAIGGLSPLLVLYTVAVRRPARTSAPAAVVLAVLIAVVLLASPFQPSLADLITNTLVIGAGWALGQSVRGRRAYTAGLEERNRALLAAREARTQAVVVGERTRIAREMQDLVTHGLTALTVQATAARRLLRSDPDTAEALLAGVENAGHDAVEEMRRILSVLRCEDDAADRRPQPGVADLEQLIAEARSAGLAVELTCSGTPVELDAGVALTAYRLVQEALANSRQHAGQAGVRVALDWRPDGLVLAVEDDGRGVLPDDGDAPEEGRGLRSLSERVHAYGGRLRAGPRSGGGFAVSATLPTTGATP